MKGSQHVRPRDRARAFCTTYGIDVPILLAPMAGACPVALSIAVANAGGMGAMGAVVSSAGDIREWVRVFRAGSAGLFQLNTWIPDPPPRRDQDRERRVRHFLSAWGPAVPETAGDVEPEDFAAQCQAFVDAAPPVVSSIMGLYPPETVLQFRQRRIAWFATVTTLAEAQHAQAAGADAVVAQGFEAGGHRGSFDHARAERQSTGLVALIPDWPTTSTFRSSPRAALAMVGVAAAITLGASAAMIGTAFLRCPEAATHPAWADQLKNLEPEDTMTTRALTGRLARAVATDFVKAAAAPDAPPPAPYPVQYGLRAAMKAAGAAARDPHRVQLWAGQSAAMAKSTPAGALVRQMWEDATRLL
jgi:nitronate monooxygenase